MVSAQGRKRQEMNRAVCIESSPLGVQPAAQYVNIIVSWLYMRVGAQSTGTSEQSAHAV